ncbi:hypothetical protein B2G74_24765 [Burkholderia sp. A27]|nr:hypothetical protein B2G74_24765 [Burkholderia sp. A27]
MHARMNMDHRGKKNGEAGKRENGKRGDNHAAKATDRRSRRAGPRFVTSSHHDSTKRSTRHLE